MNASINQPRFPKRITVVGAGFLGMHLVRILKRRHPSTKVRMADPGSARPPSLDPAVEWVSECDIMQPETMLPGFEGAEAVVHLHEVSSNRASDRARMYAVNKEGTRNVLLTCSWAQVKRLIYVSSAETVGFTDNPNAPVNENLEFDWGRAADNHYMCSKYAGELQLRDAARLNVSVVTANPGSMYGPGDTRVTHRVFQDIQQGNVRVVPPGGENVVDVRDVADGLCRMLWSNVSGERFILGGQNLTFAEINSTIAAALKVDPARRTIPRVLRGPVSAMRKIADHLPGRNATQTEDFDSGFVYRFYSSAKAQQQLGWAPRHTFDETVRDAAADFVTRKLLAPVA